MNNSTRTAFITGAAQGIGRSTAEILLDRGWTVGVYDISDDVSWAEGRKGAVTGHLDVRDPDEWRDALRSFAETFGDGVNPGELGNEPRVCEVLGGPRSARKRQFLAVLQKMAEREAFVLVDEILFKEGVRSPPFYTTSVGEEAKYEALWHESQSDHMPLVIK